MHNDYTALIIKTPLLPHGGILRVPQIGSSNLLALCDSAIERLGSYLAQGYVFIVEPGVDRRILPWRQRWGIVESE